MSIQITLDLSPRDLKYFRDAVQRARRAVAHADEAVIIEAIGAVVEEIKGSGPLPDFIASRLPALEVLIRMLTDEDWALPDKEREQLLATFIYFCDPEDLIPDDIPGIGYLDDVIMLELLAREMQHVSDAYQDFCAYRDNDESANLESKRDELHARMRERRAADEAQGQESSLW